MNFKKLKRLASVVLSLSMVLSMNVTAFATDLDTVEEAANGNIAALSALADRAETATHSHFDAQGNSISGTPVWSDWEVAEEAGCETPGYKMRHCTVEFCYEVEVNEIEPLGHDYNEGTVTKAATCSQTGTKQVICQRDSSLHGGEPEEVEVEIPMVPHDFENGTEVTIPATCTKPGQTGTACAYGCGTLDPTSIQADPDAPATGHSYKAVDPSKINTAAALNALTSDEAAGITVNKATCTSAGSLVLECKNKNCDGTEAEKKIEKTIVAPGHTYDKYISGKDLNDLTTAELQALSSATDDGIVVTKAPSCTTPGSVTFECKNSWDSSASTTKEIPALGHDWDEGTVTKAPTCESKGTKTSTCDRCGITDSVDIAATGHSFGKIDTANLTNEKLTELANASDSASKGITARPATCVSKGSLKLDCTKTDCDNAAGAHVTAEVAALGHSYGKIDVDEENKEVTAEALEGIETDKEKGIKVEFSSCTTTGKLTLTCQNENCDDNNVAKEYTILSSEHTWTEKTYRTMSCKTNQTGMILKTCSVCGATEWVVIPVAHAYEADDWFDTAVEDTDFTVETDRTCTTDGTVIPTCNVCGETGDAITYPKTGHSFGAKDYTWPDSALATDKDLEAAKITEAASVASTCTSAGYAYYVCTNEKCDDSDVKAVTKHSLPTAAHDYAKTAVTKAATCTKPEMTAKFCQNKGCDAYEGELTTGAAAKGHDYSKKQQPTLDEVKEAGIEGITSTEDLSKKGDCVTAGYNYYICTDPACDKGRDYIKKFDTEVRGSHDMQPAKETIPATCLHPEQMHETCTICGYDEVVPTPPELAGEFDDTLEHDYTEFIEYVVKPNCTEGSETVGVAKYGCANGPCGTTQLKTIQPSHDWEAVKNASDLNSSDYEPGDTTPYQAPTCNAAGYQYEKCSICGKVRKETVDKLEHKYTEKATDAEDLASIQATDNTVTAVSKASTCKDNGYEYYRCVQPNCQKTDKGHYKKETLPLDSEAHDYQSGQHVDASCVEPEKTGTLCTICGATEPGTTPTIGEDPLGHVDERDGFDKKGTEANPLGDYSKLSVSTLQDLEAEGIDEPLTKAPTCTQAGYEYRNCSDCPQATTGHAIKVTIAALDHDYEFTEEPSTCTEPGKLTVTCKRCGETTKTDIASDPAKGHSFKEYSQVDATCAAAGKTAGWECEVCHVADTEHPEEHPAREIIQINPENHVWEKVDDDPRNEDPDCTSDQTGIQVYVCKNHPTVERVAVVPAVHQWEAPVMQNCVNMPKMPGLLYHTCAICGDSEIMTYLTDCVTCDSAVHEAELAELQKTDSKYQYVVVKPTTQPAQAATCTATGLTEGKVCSCKKVLTAQTEVPMIPHEGELAIKDPGDCGHDGIKQHLCATCNQFYGEEVTFESEDSGNHDYQPQIIDATCEHPMMVQMVCAKCGDKQTAQEVTGTKLPHQFGDDGICTECGAPAVRVVTEAETRTENGKEVLTFANSFEINDTDNYEILEAGVNYIVSKSRIDMGREQLEKDLVFETKWANTKTNQASSIAGLRKYGIDIDVTGRTSNPVAAKAYIKIKVNGKEEYRYGELVVRTFTSDSYLSE